MFRVAPIILFYVRSIQLLDRDHSTIFVEIKTTGHSAVEKGYQDWSTVFVMTSYISRSCGYVSWKFVRYHVACTHHSKNYSVKRMNNTTTLTRKNVWRLHASWYCTYQFRFCHAS